MQNIPELLAPAGSPDAGYAALHYGADAVYLGLGDFSARAEATNFTPAELDEFTAYAHAQTPRRRVYAAVNTLIQQREIPRLLTLLAHLAAVKIDAVIVQDLGLLTLLQKKFPAIAIHASTQMAVHNLDTAKFLRDVGVRRVTLARELTLPEIKAIAALENIESEFFLHGALCYAYSGLCLFSSHLIGRSANRGRCVYPCRDQFRAPRGAGHWFSMKDLSLAENPAALTELINCGVTSLKIEGRKKSALYVAAAVDFYRRLLDGKIAPAEISAAQENLRTIFSRNPCTSFVANAARGTVIDREYVGHRGVFSGNVERVILRAEKKFLIFRTTTPLELHDGLQLNLGDQERPFGFAIDELFILGGTQWKRSFTAARGEKIAVLLPPDTPHLPIAAEIYRASSQAVKRAYDFVKPRPRAFRNLTATAVEVTLTPTEIIAQATLVDPERQPTSPITTITARYAGNFTAATQPEKVATAVREAFAKIGDYPLFLAEFTLQNPQALFVPLSLLNQLRRDLYTAFAEHLTTQREIYAQE